MSIKIQTYNALESLLPSVRREAALKFGEHENSNWSDFNRLATYLDHELNKGTLGSIFGSNSVTVAITWSMAKIAQRLKPTSEIVKAVLYCLHPLYACAVNSHCRPFEKSVDKQTQINASIAIRTIIEKGESFLQDPEIDTIGTLLLNAKMPEVMEHIALATLKISKSPWRNKIRERPRIFPLPKLLKLANHENELRVRKIIIRTIASADPEVFLELDKELDLLTELGKDEQLEEILITCLEENDPRVKIYALSAISAYLEKQEINKIRLDKVLVQCLEDNDSNIRAGSLSTINALASKRSIKEPRFTPIILRMANNSNINNRSNIFLVIRKQSEKEKLVSLELLPTLRKYITDHNDIVRQNSVFTFGISLLYDQHTAILPTDISTLLKLAYKDKSQQVRIAATFALACITNQHTDSLTEEQLDKIEHLCTINRDPFITSQLEKITINEVYKKLVQISGLKDLLLLIQLEGHPSKDQVDKLIRKKDSYREAIGPLISCINNLYQEVSKLEEGNELLRVKNEDLKERIIFLSQELEKIKNSMKCKQVNRLLWSIGGTVARNVIKGKGLTDKEFVKSLGVDALWGGLENLI